jgi:hypothetical protein
VTGEPIVTPSAVPRPEDVFMDGRETQNKEKIGRVDRQTLDVRVRDDSGGIVGGIFGHIWLRLFFLDLFYPPKRTRGAGWQRLIRGEEDAARRPRSVGRDRHLPGGLRSASGTAIAGLAKSPACRTT